MASKVDVVKLLRLAVQPPRQSIVMIDTEHQFLQLKNEAVGLKDLSDPYSIKIQYFKA